MPSTDKFVFQQSKIPSFKSDFGKRLARQLWDLKLYFHDGRRDRDLYVRECDSAYLCHRFVPDTGAIMLIEDGEFGESDLHDITNVISIRLALSLMPRNDPWLTVSSREGDADTITQGIQDWQMSLHRKAKTRRQMQRFIKQLFVRGTSWIEWDWQDHEIYRSLVDDEHTGAVKDLLRITGMSEKEAKNFTARGRDLRFSGPIVKPVDYYDVWVEPAADIISDRKPATIRQQFRHLSALQAEKSANGKNVYSNLEDLEPYPLEEIWNNYDFVGDRRATHRIFGRPSTRITSGIKLVPVYVFHLPYFEYEGYEFWDTYFYLALSHKGTKPRIIRIEQNPDEAGLNRLIGDQYIDWFTQTPYGLSGMLFQLSKYHQKNFLQLLTITSMAHSVFPPNLVYESAIRNDEEINLGAGATIPVIENELGLEVIKPLQVPERGAMSGEQFLRFYADEMKASTGVDGLTSDNAARTLTKPKTATEINRDVTGGSFFLDNAAENLNDTLNEVVQNLYEVSVRKALKSAEQSGGELDYERYQGDKVIQSMLSIQDLEVKRSIQVTGVNGQLNKQQDLTNLLQFFQTIGQIPDPGIVPLKIWVAQQIAKKTNLKVPDQFMIPPDQLVAMNPAVQQAALNNALQNPEFLEAIRNMVTQGEQQNAPAEGQPQNGQGNQSPPGAAA